jgi:hypothetical protein
MGFLDNIPPEAIGPILALINAIIRIAQAGDSSAAREAAMMQAGEDLKAELDKSKFGAG